MLVVSCAEACARLCTYGSVYKDKKGQPFDALAKAFLGEFRLPPHSFPASQEEALSGEPAPTRCFGVGLRCRQHKALVGVVPSSRRGMNYLGPERLSIG